MVEANGVDFRCSKCSQEAFQGSLRDMFGTEIVRNNWVMKGLKVSALVCSSCGYIEMYTDNPKLVKARLG